MKKKYEMPLDSSYKIVDCICGCGHKVRISSTAISGKCATCTLKGVPIDIPIVKSDRPKGWHLMALFVEKDGTVFEFGKENKKLKNQYPPTNVESIKKQQKKKSIEKKSHKEEKEKKKEEKLIKLYDKKKKLKKKEKELKKKPIKSDIEIKNSIRNFV